MTTCFGKELFIRYTASTFRKLLSIYVFSYFPFGFEVRMWDLFVSVTDHCLSFLLFNGKCIVKSNACHEIKRCIFLVQYM